MMSVIALDTLWLWNHNPSGCKVRLSPWKELSPGSTTGVDVFWVAGVLALIRGDPKYYVSESSTGVFGIGVSET